MLVVCPVHFHSDPESLCETVDVGRVEETVLSLGQVWLV